MTNKELWIIVSASRVPFKLNELKAFARLSYLYADAMLKARKEISK